MRLSPAYFEAFRDEVHAFDNVHVRLTDDTALRSGGFELGDSWFADFGATTDGLRTAATALRLVALAVGLAGAFAIAVALMRVCRLTMRDHETLRALGWSSRRMAETSLTVVTPVLVAGIAIGASAGVLLAPIVQVGLARSIDPDGRAPVVVWPVTLACAAADVRLRGRDLRTGSGPSNGGSATPRRSGNRQSSTAGAAAGRCARKPVGAVHERISGGPCRAWRARRGNCRRRLRRRRADYQRLDQSSANGTGVERPGRRSIDRQW